MRGKEYPSVTVCNCESRRSLRITPGQPSISGNFSHYNIGGTLSRIPIDEEDLSGRIITFVNPSWGTFFGEKGRNILKCPVDQRSSTELPEIKMEIVYRRNNGHRQAAAICRSSFCPHRKNVPKKE